MASPLQDQREQEAREELASAKRERELERLATRNRIVQSLVMAGADLAAREKPGLFTPLELAVVNWPGNGVSLRFFSLFLEEIPLVGGIEQKEWRYHLRRNSHEETLFNFPVS